MVPEQEEEQEEEVVLDCPEGCLSAVINGELFVAETTTAVKSNIIVENPNSGVDFQSEQLDILGVIPSISLTKSLNIKFACTEFGFDLSLDNTPSDCGLFFSYSEVGFANPFEPLFVFGETGVVVIESYDGEYIKGTFSFTGIDDDGEEYTITDGVFEAPVAQ